MVYGGEFGIDLEATAERHGLTPASSSTSTAAPVYRVYMIGFMPGFTYLGGLDPSIATPRRLDPRPHDPRRHHLHRRHPGADRRPGHALGLAHPGPHAGAHLHGRARSGVPDGGRRRGGVRADRCRHDGPSWTAPPRPASRSPSWLRLDRARRPSAGPRRRCRMPAVSAGSASAWSSRRHGPDLRWRWPMCSPATARARRRSSSRSLAGGCEVEGGTARVALAGADCSPEDRRHGRCRR